MTQSEPMPIAGISNYTPEEWKRFIRIVEFEEDRVKSYVNARLSEQDENPKVVYHYTTHGALLSILKSQSFWATKLCYLNDKDEMHYGVELFLNSLKAYSERVLDNVISVEERAKLELVQLALEFTLSEYKKPDEFSFYTVSFCAGKDQSSAWQAYGNKGHGYAIGLSGAHLKNASAVLPFMYHKVFYDPVFIQSLMIEVIGEAAKRFLQRLYDKRIHLFANTEWLSKEIHYAILPILPFFKKLQWEDEREYRVFLEENTILPSKIRNTTDGRSISYIDFSIQTNKAPEPFNYLPITEIIVGSRITSLEKEEVRQALDALGYADIPLIDSQVHFQ